MFEMLGEYFLSQVSYIFDNETILFGDPLYCISILRVLRLNQMLHQLCDMFLLKKLGWNLRFYLYSVFTSISYFSSILYLLYNLIFLIMKKHSIIYSFSIYLQSKHYSSKGLPKLRSICWFILIFFSKFNNTNDEGELYFR